MCALPWVLPQAYVPSTILAMGIAPFNSYVSFARDNYPSANPNRCKRKLTCFHELSHEGRLRALLVPGVQYMPILTSKREIQFLSPICSMGLSRGLELRRQCTLTVV